MRILLSALLFAAFLCPPVFAANSIITNTSVVFPAYTGSGPATTTVNAHNDNGSINGLALNVPTGSTNGFRFQVAGSNVASLSSAGLFTPTSYGGAALSGTFSGGTFSSPTISGTVAGSPTFSGSPTIIGPLTVGNATNTGLVILQDTSSPYNIMTWNENQGSGTSCNGSYTINLYSSGVSSGSPSIPGYAMGLYCGGGIFTVDANGNVGAAGTFNGASSLAVKRNVRTISDFALLGLALSIPRFIEFCYIRETRSDCGPHGTEAVAHISYAGEEVSPLLSGLTHDHVEPVALASVAVGAVKALAILLALVISWNVVLTAFLVRLRAR